MFMVCRPLYFVSRFLEQAVGVTKGSSSFALDKVFEDLLKMVCVVRFC